MLTNPNPNLAGREENPATAKSAFKNPLLYTSIAVGVAALIVCWIMISRWLENRRIAEQERQEQAEKQRENDRLTIEQLGGSKLAIQSFYASPGELRRGQTAQLCYGVANAKTVTLEPQSNAVWPSHARCVDVSPTKDTTYTLTITDGAGHTESQSLTIKVR